MSKVYNRFAQLEAQREHALHQQRLRKIKPSLKVEAPVSMEFQHMKVNAKKKMMTEGGQSCVGRFHAYLVLFTPFATTPRIKQSAKSVLLGIT
jgi:hypothetical protein